MPTAKNVGERIHRVMVTDFSLGNRTHQTAHAVVVTNPEFPLVPESNLIHSIRLLKGMEVPELLEEAEPRLQAAGTPWRHLLEDPSTVPDDLGDLLAARGYEAQARIGIVHTSAPEVAKEPEVDVRAIAGKSGWTLLGEVRRNMLAAEGRAGEELEQYAALTRRRSVSSNVRFYLAMVDFEPVGHVGLLSLGRTGMLVDLAVRPDLRGSGYGRAIIRKMVAQSRAVGHDLTCAVHDDRPGLARLAARMGFEPAVRFVSHMAGGSRKPRPGKGKSEAADADKASGEPEGAARAKRSASPKSREWPAPAFRITMT